MDYFIGAAVLAVILVVAFDLGTETAFGGVLVVGLAELVVGS
jgi:hypothetical protein